MIGKEKIKNIYGILIVYFLNEVYPIDRKGVLNMAHLRRGMNALNAGNGVEHEPIEDDCE